MDDRAVNLAPPGFFDKGSAAQWASISRRTLDRLIARGLPVFRPSPHGKILIRAGDLENSFSAASAWPGS